MLIADGVLSSTLPSNKIAPVEVDPPRTEKANFAAKAGEGSVETQLAPVDDELCKSSSLEEIGAAGSTGSENVAVGENKAKISIQEGSNNLTSQDVEPPSLKGSGGSSGESDVDNGDSHLKGQRGGSGPSRDKYSVASSSSSSSGYQEEGFGGHELKVAVTPDGKVITGRCLTYEDGRGGPLASNFFENKLHYSSANPSYHKRRKARWRRCGGVGCTVT